MPTPEPPVDLKQVAKLFNDTLAAIRHDAPDFGALEPYATEWLKDAQDKLMRDIQAAYVQSRRLLSLLFIIFSSFCLATTNSNAPAICRCRCLAGQ
jgi:hypothetical protein